MEAACEGGGGAVWRPPVRGRGVEAACEGGAVWRPPVRGARCGGRL